MIIAVDFDGTIVEHKYPEIGKTLPGAFEVLKQLQEKGHKLILWTYRDGEDLENAVNFCLENGIIFYSVNHSHPKEDFDLSMSRKIMAEIYIDDRNIGGFPGWDKIGECLIHENTDAIKFDEFDSIAENSAYKRETFFTKLGKIFGGGN